VDGNDPHEMYAAAAEAIARARAGEGPTLIEAVTFRFHGHVMGDDDSYMDKARKQAAIAADPYPRFRARLITDGLADEAMLAGIEADHVKQIEAAVEAALASPFPDVAELRRDVYADETLVPEESYA